MSESKHSYREQIEFVARYNLMQTKDACKKKTSFRRKEALAIASTHNRYPQSANSNGLLVNRLIGLAVATTTTHSANTCSHLLLKCILRRIRKTRCRKERNKNNAEYEEKKTNERAQKQRVREKSNTTK